MSSASIIAKVKRGLSKAVAATGSSASGKVYLIRRTNNSTPLNPAPFVETPIELVNAIFKSYTSDQIDNQRVRVGDKQLVSNADVAIKEGDKIRQGSTDFTVVSVETKAPTSDALAYISQVREK